MAPISLGINTSGLTRSNDPPFQSLISPLPLPLCVFCPLCGSHFSHHIVLLSVMQYTGYAPIPGSLHQLLHLAWMPLPQPPAWLTLLCSGFCQKVTFSMSPHLGYLFNTAVCSSLPSFPNLSPTSPFLPSKAWYNYSLCFLFKFKVYKTLCFVH